MRSEIWEKGLIDSRADDLSWYSPRGRRENRAQFDRRLSVAGAPVVVSPPYCRRQLPGAAAHRRLPLYAIAGELARICEVRFFDTSSPNGASVDAVRGVLCYSRSARAVGFSRCFDRRRGRMV